MRQIFVGLAALVCASACNKSFSWSPGSPASGGGGSTSSGGGGNGLMGGGGGSGNFADTAQSGPETWKRYEVRGIQLGTSRKELAAKGFKCGENVNSRCFKIMDPRCENGGHCVLREDAFGQWFELNGAKAELDYMSIATTDTDSARAYEIRLMFGPRQLATKDSVLGKALIAKYGAPSNVNEPTPEDKQGGGSMTWWNVQQTSNGPEVEVSCMGTSDGYGNVHGTQCRMTVGDTALLMMERSKQQDLDVKRRGANQPTSAPSL